MSVTTRVYYNKLIRDNIPDIIQSKREHCEVRRIIDVQEFQQELFKKIKEEATSLSMSRTKADFLEEYADLMTVLETVAELLDIKAEEIATVRSENLLRKGKYKHQLFLQWSDDLGYKSNESPQGIPL
jgi:predicted house-cleaning noncanonical NTP pyrophosphatase (MazG superfamily)